MNEEQREKRRKSNRHYYENLSEEKLEERRAYARHYQANITEDRREWYAAASKRRQDLERKNLPVFHRLKKVWRYAEQLANGERITASSDHHAGMRMLKYGTSWAPEGEHLNRLCDARQCPDVYPGRHSTKNRLLCTNPDHYESGPPDGGSEFRYMRESGRLS